MSQSDAAKVLTELTNVLADAKDENAAEDKKMLCEDANAFGLDNLSFEDCAASIMEQTEELFAVTRLCDRFAPQYLKFCKTLERSVNYLGSAFITKTAIHSYYNTVNPKLSSLTAERLHQMISFNFRKCNAALKESNRIHQSFDLDLYNQLLSFANVLERLRSTQQRALDINIWKVEPKKYVQRKNSFTDKDENKHFTDKQGGAAPFRESPAYAIDYDVVKQYQTQAENTASTEAAAEENVTVTNTAESEAVTMQETAASEENEVVSAQAAETQEITVMQENETAVTEAAAPQEITKISPEIKAFTDRFFSGGANPYGLSKSVRNQAAGMLNEIFDPQGMECFQIMKTAAARGEQEKTDPNDPRPAYTFTEEEMVTLLENETFLEAWPDMAEEMREVLREMATEEHFGTEPLLPPPD